MSGTSLVSVVLTVHNKETLLRRVLDGIERNASLTHELVVVLDGCTDRSAEVVGWFAAEVKGTPVRVLETPDVFETRANNVGLRAATGHHVILVQDDMVIDDDCWDWKLLRPFAEWGDVFAVTARAAHNWRVNPNARDLPGTPHDPTRWCDFLEVVDAADARNTVDGVFAVRDTVNRGPLALRHDDLATLGYLDEVFTPQDSDEHDLMYRMHDRLGKVCGYTRVGWHSRPEWGGTRDAEGNTKSWMFAANHKNARRLYERHGKAMRARVVAERRFR